MRRSQHLAKYGLLYLKFIWKKVATKHFVTVQLPKNKPPIPALYRILPVSARVPYPPVEQTTHCARIYLPMILKSCTADPVLENDRPGDLRTIRFVYGKATKQFASAMSFFFRPN